MTIDKAIKDLQNSINVGLSPDIESRKLAIKALKQYGVLQEIRNELTKHYVDPYNRNAFRYTTVSLLDVLDLIDKHLRDFNA